MIDLIGPKTTCSLSVEGVEYLVKDGRVSINEAHLQQAMEHGFVEAGDEVDAGAPDDDGSDPVDSMSTKELWAMLKALGAAAPFGVTKGQLRDIVKDAMATKAAAGEPVPATPSGEQSPPSAPSA